MARFPRVNIEGVLYYITSRADHDERVFVDEKDYISYLGLLKKYKSQFKFKLFAYVLLPDHFHLLIELSKHGTISQIMHSLNPNYTKYFNSCHNRQGHLFQARYKMTVAEKQAYLLAITAYIHTNPKALKLVEESKDYPYSSLACYLRSARPKEIEQGSPSMAGEVNEVMSGPMRQKGFVSYRDYLASVTASELQALAKDLAKRPVLGSDEFIRKIKVRVKMRPPDLVYGTGRPATSWRKRLLLAGLAAIAALVFLNLYIYAKSQERESRLKSSFKEKEAEVSQNLQKQYQQQIDEYYKGVAKKLQMEKQKAKTLEERLLTGTEKDRGGK